MVKFWSHLVHWGLRYCTASIIRNFLIRGCVASNILEFQNITKTFPYGEVLVSIGLLGPEILDSLHIQEFLHQRLCGLKYHGTLIYIQNIPVWRSFGLNWSTRAWDIGQPPYQNQTKSAATLHGYVKCIPKPIFPWYVDNIHPFYWDFNTFWTRYQKKNH